MRELYRLVLVDTPLAPYFSECITSEVLSRYSSTYPSFVFLNDSDISFCLHAGFKFHEVCDVVLMC